MGRPCTICAHPQAAEINAALIGGASFRAIAGQFSVARSAVANHARKHLPARIAEGSRALQATEADASAELCADVSLALAAIGTVAARREGITTLRQRLALDLGHLDRIIFNAAATGNAVAATRAIATRWAILTRVNLCNNLDTAPDLPPVDEDGGDVQGSLQAILLRLVAGEKETDDDAR